MPPESKPPVKTIVSPFAPTKIQLDIYNNPAKFKVVVMGRRSGKSTLAVNIAIRKCIEKPKSRIWIVATTYGNAKDIYWRDAGMLRTYILPEMGAKLNESELMVTFPNGSVLQWKGADRPDTLRGSGLNYLVLDEVGEWRNAEETWEAVLKPALGDKRGEALFIGTPHGENFFKKVYDFAVSGKEFWEAWRVPTWESGVPWVRSKEGKMFLDNERATKNEDWFMQEWGADFRKFTGLVYPVFDRSVHVKEFVVPPSVGIEAGMDFGYKNPTVCLFSYFDSEGNWYIFDEYYKAQQDYDEHSGMIRALRNKYPNPLKWVIGDSEDPQAVSEYAKRMWYVTPVSKKKDSITSGITLVTEKLKVDTFTKKPSLIIHPRCENLISEFEKYHWANKRGGGEKDEPEKEFDHAMDALRYIILHHSNANTSQGFKFEPVKASYRPVGSFY